ncbi:glycoside hydrolase [Thozetella sp. PMI_491]|nr:glycoside hydrolase [Thozetella sp. PMI_491]
MNYFLYKQDFARLAALGVPYYSFSISWSRILPFGIANSPVNEEAIQHYDDLINSCLEYGITPIVTLWHFDTPLPVDLTSDSFIENFSYYAKIVMAHFADRVPFWVTFNEPNIALVSGLFNYSYLLRILEAHAEVYHWYKEELNGTAKISVKLANLLAYPLHGPDNADDVAAALRYQDVALGIAANPIFLGRQVPEDVLNTPGANFPGLTEEQIERLNGTADFFAVDPYVAQFAAAPAGGVEACLADSSHPSWPLCAELSSVQDDGWLIGSPSQYYPYIAPQYVRQQLKYIWDVFHPAGGILVAEFGFPQQFDLLKTLPQQRYDLDRSLYFQGFLNEMLKAVHEDGVKVIGTLAWSFVESNEVGAGDKLFGLQTVDFQDGNFTRTYKRSFFDYVDFFTNSIN